MVKKVDKENEVVSANKVAVFKEKKIRKQFYNGEWYFVITDVVAALIDTKNATGYLKILRHRDPELAKLLSKKYVKGGLQNVTPLALPFSTTGGKQRLKCLNTEGIFRLVQSIPSPKAEPFKRWLAKVGYERIQEIENPELAQ
jgi:prophage antirepressor-like protein